MCCVNGAGLTRDTCVVLIVQVLQDTCVVLMVQVLQEIHVLC